MGPMTTTIQNFPTDRAEAKRAVFGAARIIRTDPCRTTLVFADLEVARIAAETLRQVGIVTHMGGGNQPVLTTAADFPEKA